jgi:hypothetical protein
MPRANRIPLHVWVNGGVTSGHLYLKRFEILFEALRQHPAISTIDRYRDILPTRREYSNGNTIVLDPPNVHYKPEAAREAAKKIAQHRREFPNDVFMFCTGPNTIANLCKEDSRFEHYFRLIEPFEVADVLDVLDQCEQFHRNYYPYDVGISFAGRQRVEARAIAKALKDNGAKVFFDEYAKPELLGQALTEHLYSIYAHKCRYTVILVSKAYLTRIWTNHERAAAQERALKERGVGYILPIRVDDSCLPGMPQTIGFHPLANNPVAAAKMVLRKLFIRRRRPPLESPLPPESYSWT